MPTGNTVPEAGAQVTGRDPSTRSVAVALYVTVAPDADVEASVWFAGTVTAGGVVSRTVTTKLLTRLVLPRESLPVQPTVVAPSAKVKPDGGVQVTATGVLAVSVPVTVYTTSAPVDPVASTIGGVGSVSTGGVVSRTRMVNVLARLVLPRESLPVQLTVVVPNANVEPDSGAHVTATGALAISVAVTV